MRSLDLLRALSDVGRRDLERALADLDAARAEAERLETEVQVASQRLAIERSRCHCVDAFREPPDDEAAEAGDDAIGAAFWAHVRQRMQRLESALEASRADLSALRELERSHEGIVRRALERCEGVDERIRRAVLDELSARATSHDELSVRIPLEEGQTA